MGQFFSISASAVMIMATVVYFIQVKKSLSTPNPAAWVITLFAGAINTLTYILAVDGNWIKGSVLIVMNIGTLIILVYAWRTGKVSPVDWFDWIAFVISCTALTFFLIHHDPKLSNLIMQAAMAIPFVVIVRGQLKHTLKEYPIAWSLGTTAYALMTIGVLWNFDGNWISLVFPIINGLGGNVTVMSIAYIQNQKP